MLSMLSQPKQQNAEATIITLCDRLAHSTEIEDRRAAALALKGFSHSYRELIASSGLQGLIDALKTDSYDQDLRRACLETLIVLFVKTGNGDLVETARRARERNKTYVSPLVGRSAALASSNNGLDTTGDEISLLLTDRFTQVPENIELLLKFVEEQPDVFSTLYSLQLISAIVFNRPDRAREALLSIPNGISLLVRTLESPQEMVRNEGILLLLNLTENDLDSQKLVVFEGSFEYILNILHEEGGLAFGTQQIIEDCLGLLANLIEYNVSNQKLFCDSSLPEKFGSLLDFEENDAFLNEVSVANIVTALEFPRLFCIPDAELTGPNQIAFGKSFLLKILRLAFGPASPLSVRTAALVTCASLIWANNELQKSLSEIDVPYYDLSVSVNVLKDPTVVPVTTAILNWMCLLNTAQTFDLRAACLLCLNSLFQENEPLRSQFVADQNFQYKDDSSENCNIISLLAEYNESVNINPFQVWFACALLISLFQNSPAIKDQFRAITIGDEKLGQEVSPVLQSIGSQLLASLSYREPFVSLGYLQLLSVWLFDDVPAVNEFLAESAAIQGLVHYVVSNREIKPNVLVQSLATVLLGIVYDFSSKDSPFNRTEFHKLLISTIGKDQFVHQIRRFHESQYFHDFNHSHMFGAAKGENGLPEIYLDHNFFQFISENISRIQKAVNKGPDFEPTSRVSLEMYEVLREQQTETQKRLDELSSEKKKEMDALMKKEKKLNTSLDDLKREHAKLVSSSSAFKKEHSKLKSKLEDNTKALDTVTAQLTELKSTHEKTITELEAVRAKHSTSDKKHQALQTQFNKISDAKEKAETGINKMTRELMTLTKQRDTLDKDLVSLRAEHNKVSADEKELNTIKASLESQLAELKTSNGQMKATNDKLVAKLRETAEILKQKEEDDALLELAIEDVEKLKSELDAANSRIQNFERENKLMKGKIDTSKKESKSQSEKIAQLNSKLQDQLKQLESAQGSVDELIELKLQIEAEKQATADAKTELQSIIKSSETKQGALLDTIKELKEKISTSEADKTSLQGKITEQSTTVESLKSKLAAKDKKVSNLEKQLASLEKLNSELNEMKQKLNKAQEELDQQLKAVAKLKAEKALTSNLEAAHSKALENLKTAHSQELTKSLEAKKRELREALKDHNAKLEEQSSEHEQDKDSLRNSHAKELQQLRDENQKATHTLKESHSQSMEEMKQAHTDATDSLGQKLKTAQKNETELKESIKVAEESVQSISLEKLEHTKTISQLEAKLESQAKEHSSELEKAKGHASAAFDKASKMENDNKKHVVELNVALKESQSESEKLKASLAEKISALESELEATKSSSKGASDKLIEAFKARIATKDAQIASLGEEAKIKHTKAQDQISLLETQLKETQDEKLSIESTYSKNSKGSAKELLEIKASKTGLQKELDMLKEKSKQAAESATSERDALAKELESLKIEFKQVSEGSEKATKLLEEQHSTKLTAKSDQIAKLEKRLQAMEDKHNDISSQLDLAVSESKNSSKKDKEIAKLQENLKQLDTKDQEIKKLKSKLEELASKDKEIEAMEQQLNEAATKDQEIKDLTQKLESLSAKDEEIIQLKSQLKKQSSKVSEVDDLRSQLEELSEKDMIIDGLNQQLKQVSVKDTEISSLKSQLESLSKKVDDANDANEKLATQLNTSKETEKKLSQLKDELAEAKSSAKRQIESQNRQYKELEKQRNEAVENYALLSKSADSMKEYEGKLAESSCKITGLEKELESLKAASSDVGKLKSSLEEKSTALDELMELLDDLAEGKSKYKSQVKDLGQDVSESEDEDEDED